MAAGTAAFLSQMAGILQAWRVSCFALRHHRARQNQLVEKSRDFVTPAAGMFATGKTAAEVLEESSSHIPDPLGGDLKSVLALTRGAGECLSSSKESRSVTA